MRNLSTCRGSATPDRRGSAAGLGPNSQQHAKYKVSLLLLPPPSRALYVTMRRHFRLCHSSHFLSFHSSQHDRALQHHQLKTNSLNSRHKQTKKQLNATKSTPTSQDVLVKLFPNQGLISTPGFCKFSAWRRESEVSSILASLRPDKLLKRW